eukprot:CAMPEP_0177753010 /NCGR_PEP_ID=MMETSP0491_2-20121128/1222_1 /TAXON_ID=63592 /ORGANISM="Tetraselmis chuii, Strain PLY429" /LENGTH=91 /DNA_ID=CAMNT_0019268247 /DNA_START=172 /DNA_END=447 /DNA_ORIENTATION=-
MSKKRNQKVHNVIRSHDQLQTSELHDILPPQVVEETLPEPPQKDVRHGDGRRREGATAMPGICSDATVSTMWQIIIAGRLPATASPHAGQR